MLESTMSFKYLNEKENNVASSSNHQEYVNAAFESEPGAGSLLVRSLSLPKAKSEEMLRPVGNYGLKSALSLNGGSPRHGGAGAGLLDVAAQLGAAAGAGRTAAHTVAGSLSPTGGRSKMRRSSSMADIAMAITGRASRDASITDLSLSGREFIREWRRNNQKYVHPFGNTPTIVEELFAGSDPSRGDQEINKTKQSPAKLVIWVVFTLVMLGMAGAIVLGAETSKKDVSASALNVTTMLPDFRSLS